MMPSFSLCPRPVICRVSEMNNQYNANTDNTKRSTRTHTHTHSHSLTHTHRKSLLRGIACPKEEGEDKEFIRKPESLGSSSTFPAVHFRF